MHACERRRYLAWLTAGVAAMMCAVGIAQTTDPAYGVWKLDVAKSKYSPGPAPREQTVTIEPAGPGRKVTVKGVASDGTPIAWGYTGNFDSKQNRLTGSNPDADFVLLKRLSPTTTRSTFKKNNKTTLVNGVSVSADGKTLTVASSGVNAKGETVKNTQVFTKQ
jgi:hypothetical protein